MALNRALGVRAADPGTRVLTLVLNTGQGHSTVGVDRALRLALDVRVAEHLRQAGAGGGAVSLVAPGIGSARRGSARVDDLWSWRGRGWSVALRERIADEALVTDTDWHMVSNSAVGIDAAEARTRVLAFSADAGLVRRTVRVDNTLWAAVWREAFHVWEAGALALIPVPPRLL